MDKILIHHETYDTLNQRRFSNVSIFYFFLILFFRTLLKFHVVNRKTDEVLEATNVVTYAVYMFLFLIFVTTTFILTIPMNVLYIPE